MCFFGHLGEWMSWIVIIFRECLFRSWLSAGVTRGLYENVQMNWFHVSFFWRNGSIFMREREKDVKHGHLWEY